MFLLEEARGVSSEPGALLDALLDRLADREDEDWLLIESSRWRESSGLPAGV